MLVYITFNQYRWRQGDILGCDVGYYYLYLPSAIIYEDLGALRFYPAKIDEYGINGRRPTYELYPQKKTGRITNKYAVGVAICELPFFLVAHGWCLLTHANAADGFSMPYRVSIVFATLCWVIMGLLALRKLLLLYCDERTTAVTILLVAFATNLYFYTVDNPGMSHPFSFAIGAMLCYASARAYATGRWIYIAAAGFSLGLVTIVRPVNVLMVVFPLLWPTNLEEGRLQVWWRHKATITLSIILFTAILFIQLGYLKYTSGEWLHFSYEEEGFILPHSEMWNGLFSYRKGWFVYTPLAFMMIPGILLLMRQRRNLGILIAGFILVFWYVIFSWHQWWYGGGFGARPMVDVYAILALPLAAVVHGIIACTNKYVRVSAMVIGAALITLNVFQSYQLINEVTRWDKTTRSFYWRSFGKVNLSDADKKLP